MIDMIITPNYSDCQKFAVTQNARKPVRLLCYKGMPELMRKSSMLTLKELQQCKVVEILLSESQVYWRNAKLQRSSGRFLFSNLQTGRYDLKSGVSWVLWESWQHCTQVNKHVNKPIQGSDQKDLEFYLVLWTSFPHILLAWIIACLSWGNDLVKTWFAWTLALWAASELDKLPSQQDNLLVPDKQTRLFSSLELYIG